MMTTTMNTMTATSDMPSALGLIYINNDINNVVSGLDMSEPAPTMISKSRS